MKLTRFAMFAAVALGMAACSTPVDPVSNGSVPVSTPTPAPAPTVNAEVLDAKALAAAELAYNVPAFAYVKADTAGLLSVGVKAKVKPIMLDAHDALKKARTAYAAKNALEFFAQKDRLDKLSAAAKAILPKL